MWPSLNVNSIWKSFSEIRVMPVKLQFTSGNLFCNMSDARETAIYRVTGITHISEKISRCC